MAEQPLPPPELSPLPWAIDPDPREGYEWNVHIVERDHPHMRVCFMSNCSQAELNAAFIVKAVNNHEAMDKLLAEAADFLNNSPRMEAMDLGNKITQFRRQLQGLVGQVGDRS